MIGRRGNSPRTSIRRKIIAIAAVPCAALLVIGTGGAGYLAFQGWVSKDFGSQGEEAGETMGGLLVNMQNERMLTIQRLTAPERTPQSVVDGQRAKTDAVVEAAIDLNRRFGDDTPAIMQASMARFEQQVGELPAIRQRVDSRQASVQDAYFYYSGVLETFFGFLRDIAPGAPNPETATIQLQSWNLVTVAEGFSRSAALGVAAFSGTGLTSTLLQDYGYQVGAYRSTLQNVAPALPADEREQYEQLRRSPEWVNVTRIENAVLRARPSTADEGETRYRATLPVDPATVERSGEAVGQGLGMLANKHTTFSAVKAREGGDRLFKQALVVGALLLVIALAAFLISLQLAGRLIARLQQLRADTLDLATERLPAIVARLRKGEQFDAEREMPKLEHGEDEIGQVAEAFNQAQQTAVSAAVQEAETRAGTGKVFLNIAHRSQVLVHRQLKVLDQAEREQEDPDQLNLLFQLDHLATRARRNAENLIILGGGQPGRQWRNPVPLLQVVRSAIGEAESYIRVSTGDLPKAMIEGAAVADLIHLLAELVDNATNFSPPTSRVDVRGNLVGRGLVIEVEDQGLGIERGQRDEFNAMLHEPPDFSVMALSDEPRLGLFVVAQLASRHGIRVTLDESPAYGGIRAIVLVPSALLAGVMPEPAALPAEPEAPAAPMPRRAAQLPPPPVTAATPPSGMLRPAPMGRPYANGVHTPKAEPLAEPAVIDLTGVEDAARHQAPVAGRAAWADAPRAATPNGSPSHAGGPAAGPGTPAGSSAYGRPAAAPAAPATPAAPPTTPAADTGPPTGSRRVQPRWPDAGPISGPGNGPASGPADAPAGSPASGPISTPTNAPVNGPVPGSAPAPGGATPPAGFATGPSTGSTGSTGTSPATPASGGAHVAGGRSKPALPRRTRQANLAPQLLKPSTTREPEPPAEVTLPSAEAARARFAALQRGTRQGRAADPHGPR